MTDLERDLRRAAADAGWPPTPDLAPGVRARVDAEGRTPVPRRRWAPAGLRPAIAVPAALAVVLGVTAAVPPARSAVLRLLGLQGGERVVRTDRPPVAPSRPPALGERVTLAQARDRVRFPVRVPAELGAPTAVGLSRRVPGGAVSLAYGTRHVLTAFEGSTTPYAEKLIGPGTRARPVEVRGARGVFLTGAPFRYVVLDRRGRVVEQSARLVDANVLLWQQRRVAYRLETRAGLAEALRIARSLR